MDHMKLIGTLQDIKDEGRTVCYILHHPVFKETSSTTKVRVAFDGSAKTSTDSSLNDSLLTGPVIQDDLLDLMIRFRNHTVALVADVAKMYRQVRIHPDDTPLQRILWRSSQISPNQIFELQTITYGLSSSSFIETRVLKQLASDVGGKYEHAGTVVSNDFYMDDFLSGADTVEEAKRLRNDVQSLMAEGEFELRKWSSNSSEVLSGLSPDALEGQSTLYFEAEQKVKTLGVAWETGTDCLRVDIPTLREEEHWTKRRIFSTIAQLYDPLGLVSPVVAWAKIQMQHLWLVSVDWDDKIPYEICGNWKDFYEQLPLLQSFKVPRCVLVRQSSNSHFHVFCDARSINGEGEHIVQLITSKSRVALWKTGQINHISFHPTKMFSSDEKRFWYYKYGPN
ncbi:uncharacterized protein LOC134222689 [Armigeres subalbatus]|uniref:uncharacterized protein LOC134222689 n=1 Tax=Armigeres subalbatus TaxID=124917 RepID=UPI002ED40792